MVTAENDVNAVLESLLGAQRSTLNIDELRLLVEGQLAAPENIDPDSWMSLVVPDPSDDLREALRAFMASCKPKLPELELPSAGERLASDVIMCNLLSGSAVPIPTLPETEPIITSPSFCKISLESVPSKKLKCPLFTISH